MLVNKCAKACDECKRRKRRCQGGAPCTWCLSHNISCSLQNDVNNSSDSENNSDMIIRTHKKKHKNNNYNEQVFIINTQAINTLAQELGVNFELSKYYTYFSYNVPVTMLTGVNWSYIESAEGLSNKFIKYAVCALTARACGNMKHSDSLISDAMRLCKTLTDEISLSSLTGFMLIYVYFLSFDPPLAKTYADIAFKIFHQLSKSKQALPVTTTTSLELYHSIMTPSQNEFEKSQKIESFLSKTIDTALSTKDAYLEFVVTQMRLVAKFLGHSKSNELHGVRIDILTILDCHMEFTESQRDDVITEVEACRNLLQNIPNRRQYYSIDICEMIVNWRSGKTAIALAAAKQFAETVVIDSFLLGTHFEVEHLLLVTMILYDSQQYPLAQKLFEMACLLHPRVRPICSLSDSVDPIVQFMTHNISFSSLLSANDLPANPALLSSIVKNMLSLCSPFLVSGPNSLLSPHGMSILFKSLISLCPPSPSKYNLFPLAHVPSNSSYSPQAFLLPESPHSLSPSPYPSPSSSSLSTSPSPSPSCYSLSPSPSPSPSLSSSQQTVATQQVTSSLVSDNAEPYTKSEWFTQI